MESKSYKELQALAKLNGIRANLSKAVLIDKLAAFDKVSEDAQESSSSAQANAEIPQAHSLDTPEGNAGKPQDEVNTPKNDPDMTEGGVVSVDRVGPEVLGARSERRRSDRLSVAKVVPAPLDPVEPEALEERSERRRSDRLPAANKAVPAPLDPVEPEVLEERSERRRSDRLSASEKKEERTVNESSRKTKVKQPTAGLARRFERMHQSLFAGQASIETYGKTPKKKTGPAKENVPLSKVTPVRPFAFGSGVKSAKRGLTVASKPCTLVVQRSSKKPTQIKEFRLSSNQPGKREPFKPYSGPVRPMNLANKAATFNVGSSSSGPARLTRKNKTRVGVKATLASGKAQSSRRSAHMQSSKFQRERVVTEARVGRA